MHRVFREVAQAQRIQAAPLSHQQQVTRLYRHSLKLLLSWTIDRDVFYEEADKIRARFDAVRGHALGLTALEAGQAELEKYDHPDRYVVPWMPGGSKFMRNPTPPPEIQYPDGEIPHEAYEGINTPVWPDMVPITFRPERKGGLIDFATKRYY